MKCNFCNTEVSEGTKFCPNCGNKIEVPQSLKCPQCNTEVTEGVNFCPNCGSQIGITQPQKCAKCGAELEEGEKFCSNCGTPVESAPLSHIDNKTLIQGYNSNNHQSSATTNTVSVVWDGERKKPMWNNPISVYVENQKCADFFPKENFEKKLSVSSNEMKVQLEYGKGPFNKTDIDLLFDNNQSYVLTFFFNSIGSFGYELKDTQGRIVKEDGNTSMVMVILFLLIPLFGFAYFFIKKDVQPLSAKAGLFMGFGNIAWLLICSLLF